MRGLLLAHYAIRALLVDVADPAGYDPDRMSFIQGVRVVRRQVTDQAAITPERLNAAVADTIAGLLRQHAHPELGALTTGAGPRAEDVLPPVEGDADRGVERPVRDLPVPHPRAAEGVARCAPAWVGPVLPAVRNVRLAWAKRDELQSAVGG
ncbi:hypothetical protein Pen02_80180 [Plantactinospora endophytica]|uniref:Uncharacterized protein n=1 Tax=Plantactinospora endophytica TaxID=673535 RepID=A0ABQ4EEC3_9ACTN|nr:hypothetical protein Pen02_80180 [Plantactinospora endophytica]